MPDDTYTIKEMISEFRQDVKSELVEIKADGKETKEKVGFQNGRVRKLEDWAIEAQKILEETSVTAHSTSNLYERDKSYIHGVTRVIMGIAIIIPTICTLIFGLYLKNRDYNIDEKIQHGIKMALDERVQSVTQ